MVDTETRPHRRSRARRRRRDADATREALLAAGTELFAERGFDAVPVAVIADKAGVNKAMINYHFGGKRQLYRAIVHGTFADVVARAEALAEAPGRAPELLRQVVALIAGGAAAGNPHFAAMMLREALAGGRHLDDEIMAYPVRVAEAVRRIVERGVRERSFRPVDPLLTHLSLVGSLLFFFATARMRERLFAETQGRAAPAGAAAYVRHVQELITHGLAAPAVNGRGAGGRRGRAR